MKNRLAEQEQRPTSKISRNTNILRTAQPEGAKSNEWGEIVG